MGYADEPTETVRKGGTHFPSRSAVGNSRFASGFQRSAGSPDGRLVQGGHGRWGPERSDRFRLAHGAQGLGKRKEQHRANLWAFEPGAPTHPGYLERRNTEQKDAQPPAGELIACPRIPLSRRHGGI